MMPLTKNTPQEFGQALRHAREGAAVSLDVIAARTKIGVRLLTAIEEGDFGHLPDQVFARMFVRQYLELIGAAPEQWLPGFEAAWRQFADSSQPFPVGTQVRVKRRRVGPWVVGLAVVAAAGAAVFFVETRREPKVVGTVTPESPTPEATAPEERAGSAAAPSAALPATPQPTPTAVPSATPLAPGALVVKALQAPCWVEVRVEGEKSMSRLLAAGAVWEVPAGGRGVDLVLGDAGAASVAYLGEVRSPAGASGKVARIHLAGNASPSARP